MLDSPLFGGGAEGAWLSGMVPRMSGVELRRPLCALLLDVATDEWTLVLLKLLSCFLAEPFPAESLTTPSTDAGRSASTFPSFSPASNSGRDLDRRRAEWTSEDDVGASELIPPAAAPQGESEESSEAVPTTMPLSGDWLLESLLPLLPW